MLLVVLWLKSSAYNKQDINMAGFFDSDFLAELQDRIKSSVPQESVASDTSTGIMSREARVAEEVANTIPQQVADNIKAASSNPVEVVDTIATMNTPRNIEPDSLNTLRPMEDVIPEVATPDFLRPPEAETTPTIGGYAPRTIRTGIPVQSDQGLSTAPLEEYAGMTRFEPPTQIGDPRPYRRTFSNDGTVTGTVYTVEFNGQQREIIDVSESTSREFPIIDQRRRIPENEIRHLVIHNTGGMYHANNDREGQSVRSYINSFRGRSYGPTASWFIDEEGNIYKAFDPNIRNIHVAGGRSRNPENYINNDNSIGIEVEAGGREDLGQDVRPNQAQQEATAFLVDLLSSQYNFETVTAHPQSNTEKQRLEGFTLLNHWRETHGLDPIQPRSLTASDESRLLRDPGRRPAPSRDVVREVQAAVGATVDGAAGPATERAMRRWIVNSGREIPPGADRNDLVRFVYRYIAE
jgi:hypothetical protein